MNSTTYLNNELIRIFEKFQDAIIKYEFKPSRNTHLIEVTPLEIYQDEKFINEEIDLMESFFEKYADENILFVSEESMNKVQNPTFLFKKTRLSLCYKNNEVVTEPYFDELQQNFFLKGESNFFLAA